jgi:hypothetical protein
MNPATAVMHALTAIPINGLSIYNVLSDITRDARGSNVDAPIHLGVLLTIVPLGIFLTWASISMIRQKWMYLLVGDSYLWGKPSLAMLPLGLSMVTLPFTGLVLGLGGPIAGLFSVFSIGCMVLGLAGCVWVPRFLHPSWMKVVDEGGG